tara:strand:+ start:843 stop:1661 length:819 start_codon:yes stop_codon:yes gene_type:complete
MASFFSKFVRGASQSGATLYADVARDQMRADIQTKRDTVLNNNRTEAARTSQEASTLQHKERLAQRESEYQRNQQSRLAQRESEYQRNQQSPQAKAAKIKLASAENLGTLKAAYSAATTDEERESISKQMAAEQGKPVENLATKAGAGPTAATKEARILATLDEFPSEAAALKFLKSKEGNMVKSIFTQLLKSQEENYLSPDDPNFLTVETALLKARDIAKPQKQEVGGDDNNTEHFNTTKYPSIQTQEDFNKLKSGDLYFDIFDGKSYRKP